MRKLIWARLGLLDFEDIQNYIASHNPDAAERITQRILQAIATLPRYPFLGRALNHLNLRAFVVGGSPFLIVYRATGETIFVTRIWHSSRDMSNSTK